MSNHCISVIIPYYNAGKYIEQALASVRAQAYAPLEIILVDDGSTDDIAVRASTWRDVVFLQQNNKGPAAARNLGLRHAKGELIAFLDADDVWPQSKLIAQLSYLQKNPALKLVTGRIQYEYLDGVPVDGFFSDQPDKTLCHVHLGAILTYRALFETVGMFDESMRFSEDQDWFLRVREQEIPMEIMEHVTLIYRRHGSNMTKGVQLRDIGLLKALKQSVDRRKLLQASQPRSLKPFSSYDRAKVS